MSIRSEQRKGDERGKVFLSYSRKDRERAQSVAEALRVRQFGVFKDTDDILPTEEWRGRLEQLITEADTIVFLLSPHSAASEVCAWEVELAVSLNKRIAPIVIEDVDGPDIPPHLARLNFIFCTPRDPFENAVDTLISALNTDIEWIREHTRLTGLVQRWVGAGRSPRLLLRGQDIQDAEAWRDSRPGEALAVTQEQAALISESRAAAGRRQRNLVLGAAAIAVAGIALAIFAYLQSIEADAQRVIAEENAEEADRQREVADAERNEVLRGQSLFLADAAERALEAGDTERAALLALAGLPDPADGVVRPLVPQTLAIGAATESRLGTFAELGYDLVSDLDVWESGGVITARTEEFTVRPDGIEASPGLRFFDQETLEVLLQISDDGDIKAIAGWPGPEDDAHAAFYVVMSDGTVDRYDRETGEKTELVVLDVEEISGAAPGFGQEEDGSAMHWIVGGGPSELFVYDLNARAYKLKVADTPVDYNTRFVIRDAQPSLYVYDGTSFLGAWDLESGAKRNDVGNHRYPVLSTDGRWVAWDAGGEIVVLGSPRNPDGGEFRLAYGSFVKEMFFFAYSNSLVVLYEDGRVRLWNTDRGSFFDMARPPQRSIADGFGSTVEAKMQLERALDIALSPDRRNVAVVQGNTLSVWVAPANQLLYRVSNLPMLGRVAFTSDGRHVLAGPSDELAPVVMTTMGGRFPEDGDAKRLGMWPVFKGEGILLAPEAGDGGARRRHRLDKSMVFSPDGPQAFVPYAGAVRVIDLAQWGVTEALPFDDLPAAMADAEWAPLLALSDDGRYLVLHVDEQLLAVWDLERLTRGEPPADLLWTPTVGAKAFHCPGACTRFAESFGSAEMLRRAQSTVREESLTQVVALPGGDLAISTALGYYAQLWRRGVATPIGRLEGNPGTGPSISPDGDTLFLLAGRVLYRHELTPDIETTVARLKDQVTRCLDPKERLDLFLPPAPPAWCIEQALPPYDTEAWRAWQDAGRSPGAADMP